MFILWVELKSKGLLAKITVEFWVGIGVLLSCFPFSVTASVLFFQEPLCWCFPVFFSLLFFRFSLSCAAGLSGMQLGLVGCVYWQGAYTFGDCLEVSRSYPVPFVCCFRLHCASRAGCLFSLIKFSRFKKKSLVLLFVKHGFELRNVLFWLVVLLST